MPANPAPTVSVVIPTRGRPNLLRRALQSVLAQTHRAWEAVVVVDGPDPATEEYLSQIQDTRIKTLFNSRTLGGGETRNVGIRAASGTWVALLDDDDEWLPHKLVTQLAAFEGCSDPRVGFTAEIVRTPHGDYVWPKRGPQDGEHISDYLFARTGMTADGPMHTSTLLAPRELWIRIPFDPVLPRFQDSDWVLRAAREGPRIVYCPEPLTIRHHEQPRSSIRQDRETDWVGVLSFVRDRQDLMTPTARAWFLLSRGGGATAASRDLKGGLTVLATALRLGSVSPRPLAIFFSRWILPVSFRRWIRSRASSARHQDA